MPENDASAKAGSNETRNPSVASFLICPNSWNGDRFILEQSMGCRNTAGPDGADSQDEKWRRTQRDARGSNDQTWHSRYSKHYSQYYEYWNVAPDRLPGMNEWIERGVTG